MHQNPFFDKFEKRIRENINATKSGDHNATNYSPAYQTLEDNPNTRLPALMRDKQFCQHLVEALFPEEIRSAFGSNEALLSLPFIDVKANDKYNQLPREKALPDGVDMALYIDDCNRPGIAIRLVDKEGKQPDYFISYHRRYGSNYSSHWVVGRNSNFSNGPRVDSKFYVMTTYSRLVGDQNTFADYFRMIIQGETIRDRGVDNKGVDAYCPYAEKVLAATKIQAHVKAFLFSRNYKKYQSAKKDLLEHAKENNVQDAMDSMKNMAAAATILGLN